MKTGGAPGTPGSDHEEWARGQTALAKRLAAWRRESAVAPVLAAMERFGAGDALELCAPLADLLGGESERARAFADGFVAAGLAGLDEHPLGQLPLMHGRRDAAPMLMLAASGRASLALAAYDGAALERLPAPKTARFVPQETWIHVLSGSGDADLVLRRDGEGDRTVLQSGRIALQPGTTFYRYGLREALHVRRVNGTLVMLRLQRQFAASTPAREYSLPDGALVHQSAGQPDDTRRELAVSLLGRMGRKDAVPQMARIALGEAEREGEEGLRWQALREVLALDSTAGFELLGRISTCDEDPLAGPAAKLHASLLDVSAPGKGA